MVNATLPKTILKTLQGTLQSGDIQKGIILSASFLEAYSIRKLKAFFRKCQLDTLHRQLDDLTFDQLALTLYALHIIDEHTYQNMLKIRSMRDAILARKTFINDRTTEEENRHLIEAAISIFKTWDTT